MSLWALALWAGLAWAQEAGPEPEAPQVEATGPGAAGDEAPPDTDAPEAVPAEAPVAAEVVVYGERLVEAARQEVIEQAAKDGYVREIRKKDRTILRHDQPWKGDVVLYDDGRLDIKRQPVRFEPPVENKTPASWLMCVFLPACIRPNGQLVSNLKFQGYKRTIMASIEPEVRTWNERISDFAIDAKIDRLPDKLEALWERGRSIDGATVHATWEERRRALFAYWDTRTDTAWGDEVRDATAAFIRGVVQRSEHPFGAAELATLDASRTSRLPFPVEPVGP